MDILRLMARPRAFYVLPETDESVLSNVGALFGGLLKKVLGTGSLIGSQILPF